MPKKPLPPVTPVEKVVPIRPGMSNATEPGQTPPRRPKNAPIRTKARPFASTPPQGDAPLPSLPKRMASGLTLKQDDFCHAYVETGNASEAYRRAYNVGAMKEATINNNAYKLLKRNDIATRVEAIRAVFAKRVLVTIETLTEEFDSARELAMERGIPAAAISATLGKAKLHGFMVDKVESTQTQFVVEAPRQDASTEDWLDAVTPKAG